MVLPTVHGPGQPENLVRAAYNDLAIRLERFFGFSHADAFGLLEAVGKVRICQVVPPGYSALAKIERKYLEAALDSLFFTWSRARLLGLR